MATRLSHRPATLRERFSFYAPSSDTATLALIDSAADAVTVKDLNGPATIGALRKAGWNAPTIFDRFESEPTSAPVDVERWFDEQEQAGADRLPTTSSWIEWDANGDAVKIAVEAEASSPTQGGSPTPECCSSRLALQSHS